MQGLLGRRPYLSGAVDIQTLLSQGEVGRIGGGEDRLLREEQEGRGGGREVVRRKGEM